MVQPIRPFYDPRSSDDDAAPPFPTSVALCNIRDLPEPPSVPDVEIDLYARALRAMSASREAREAGRVTGDPTRLRDALIQRRLDAFRAQATVRYRALSSEALVTAPFQMGGATTSPRNAEFVRTIARSVGMTEDDATRALFGRATPDEVHRLAQGLIDAGRLPANKDGESVADRVRRMMYEHGIGFDCAGYVAQAVLA